MSKKKEYGLKEYRHEQSLRNDPEYAQFYDDNHSGRGDGGFDYAAASRYEREQMMKDPTVLRGLETMNLAIKDKDFRNTLDAKTQKAIQDRVDSGEGIRGISNSDERDFYNNFYKSIREVNLTAHLGTMQGNQVKTSPKGYSKEHPAIDLLKHKQYIFTKTFSDKEVMGAAFLNNVNDAFKAIRPFFDYMSEILTHDINGEPLY